MEHMILEERFAFVLDLTEAIENGENSTILEDLQDTRRSIIDAELEQLEREEERDFLLSGDPRQAARFAGWLFDACAKRELDESLDIEW